MLQENVDYRSQGDPINQVWKHRSNKNKTYLVTKKLKVFVQETFPYTKSID